MLLLDKFIRGCERGSAAVVAIPGGEATAMVLRAMGEAIDGVCTGITRPASLTPGA